ncbi:GL13052 [Drosophila persimilis]|uniref:GL13052 n=1 Tax=Drosophila persimilis TaxID=7234 RepID=B4GUX2_DROPE|nr:GL13052 [Drosophila persimilis]
MTFYWWSHWFWITCLSVQLLSSHVHTYPRGQEEEAQQAAQPVVRQTTKLYQTTVSQTWSTATQSNIMDLTNRPTGGASGSGSGSGSGLNNFTNFSSSTSTNGSTSNSSSALKPALNSNSSSPATTTAATTASSSSPSSSSSSSTAATTTTTTTTTAAAATTEAATTNGGAATAATPVTSSATPSTPKINTEWLSDELLEREGEKAPFTLENANKEEELRRAESEHRSRKSKVLSAEYKHINRYINFSSDTKSLLTRSASAAPSVADGYDGANDDGNISSEALAIQRTYFLDAGAISAICFTVFGICCTVGTIGIVLYRRRFLNKPQALSEPDSSVYIDDSTMRDNSDEMYSLDNDSFLNSLEAMTIQNYWTDTVKHTKL